MGGEELRVGGNEAENGEGASSKGIGWTRKTFQRGGFRSWAESYLYGGRKKMKTYDRG